MICEVWQCPRPAVETLVFVNSWTGLNGQMLVCGDCLAEFLAEHLLEAA